MNSFNRTTHLKKTYSGVPRCLLWIIALFLVNSFCFAENPYWSKYGNGIFHVTQKDGNTERILQFVHYKGSRLFVELNVSGTLAEIALPVSESMIKTLHIDIPELKKANELIYEGNHYGAVNLLRSKVYPLVRFHKIPESFSALHTPIRLLINSLLAIGNLSEAEDLLSRIALDQVDLKYSELTIELMNAYLDKQAYDRATTVVNRLPTEGIYSQNIQYITDVADILRNAGKHMAVIPLYRKIEKQVTGELKTQIRMWLAYSLIFTDQINKATSIIDELEEPQPSEPLFSFYKLLQGSRAHYVGDYEDALDLLTRGFVRAQTSYTWLPEMLYLIGDCYSRKNYLAAARNSWTEIAVLYPDSLWADTVEKSLDELPQPEIDTGETPGGTEPAQM